MSEQTRRAFLIGGAVSLVGGALVGVKLWRGRAKGSNETTGRPFLLGPKKPRSKSDPRKFYAGVIDLDAKRATAIPIPFECHSLRHHPTVPGRAVLFGQRPIAKSLEIDFLTGEVLRVFESAPGRHSYGHGAYSPDGSVLLATENNYADGKGAIAVRDAKTMKIIGELDSHGIGPHEMYYLRDAKTIVIANGGMLTHPEKKRGRGALNIPTMQPSLAFVEVASGKLLDKVTLENRFLSIRHLAVSDGGMVAMSIQDKSKSSEGDGSGGSLLFVRHPSGKIVEMKRDDRLFDLMNNHSQSVSLFEDKGVACLTAPRGVGLATFWNVHSGELLQKLRIRGAAGVALTPDGTFAITTFMGTVHFIASDTFEHVGVDLTHEDDSAWGPHLTSLVV